jgi:hypothetical protein
MSEGKLGCSVVLRTTELAPVTGYYCLVQVLGDRMICKHHVQRIMTETLLHSSALVLSVLPPLSRSKQPS